MKTFRVGLSAVNAEKMWDFVMANRILVHFIKTTKEECHPADDFNKTVYVYDLLMSPETYTAFALAVPLVAS